MNPTEARLATLRAFLTYMRGGMSGPLCEAAIAEIAAIEAEAKRAPDSPAPPPARPKQIRITYDHYVEPNTKGAIVVPLEWYEDGCPVVRGCEGTQLTLRADEWVPADEPEGCEAWAVFNRFGTVMMYADNEPAAREKCDYLNGRHPDDDQQIPYRVVHLIDAELLARAKVKP